MKECARRGYYEKMITIISLLEDANTLIVHISSSTQDSNIFTPNFESIYLCGYLGMHKTNHHIFEFSPLLQKMKRP